MNSNKWLPFSARGYSVLQWLAIAASVLVWAAVAFPARAQVTQTVLYSFSGGTDGANPWAGLIADESGALYGTTIGGGISNAACFGPCGVVFKLTPPPSVGPPWTETTLWSFTGGNDGATPYAGLLARNESASQKKTLYGTTSFNGPSFPAACSGFGCGTIFKLTDSALTTLWGFTGGSDGANPSATLIGGEEMGVLYGTAEGGGTSGNGTVFKIDTIDQTLTTIYSFLGSPDGAVPLFGALLADDEGALYGTTFGGGLSGNGTVFKLTPSDRGQATWTETTLWSFTGGNDGSGPSSTLIADRTGALYGTTFGGGLSGKGTVFKLTPPTHDQTGWSLSTLYTFTGGSDGSGPSSTLIADRTGALYGTTEFGGAINASSCPFGPPGCGVVFKLTPTADGRTPWTEAVLWTFSGASDGSNPAAGLITDGTGALYGTTEFGGTLNTPSCGIFGCGVVFKMTGTGFVPKEAQEAGAQ